MNESFSRKCKVLSFCAMVTVLYIHSNTVKTFTDVAGWNTFVQQLMTRTLSSWAVPFFFCLSGYWFAAKSIDVKYSQLINKKIKGLLYPYLAWAVIGAVLSLPLYMFNNHMNHVPLLSRTFLEGDSVWQIVNRLLGVVANGPAGNLALWYVRSLIIFFLLAPLWVVVYRRARWLLFLGGFLLLGGADYSVPYVEIKLASLGWFLLGMGVTGVATKECVLPLWITLGVGALWVATGVLSVGCGIGVPSNLIALFGVVFLWSIYDRLHFGISIVGGRTFWTYCLHGPLIGYVTAGIPYVLGKTNLTTFVTCLVAPWIMIGLCNLLAIATEKLFPKTYGILCGGR